MTYTSTRQGLAYSRVYARLFGTLSGAILWFTVIPGANAAALQGASRKSPTPFFHYMWKEEISEPAVRAAVADTTGDGKPRLILLAEKPNQANSAILVIKKWNGSEFVTEFSSNVDGPPDKLAVGRFAGPSKPAEIVTADGLWTWNGTTYVRKPSQSSLSIFGVAKLRTGEERLIVSENTSHFKAYGVDTGQANTWLTAPTDAPTAGNVAWESMRASSDFFKKMGMPAFLGSGGLITIWDTSKENLPYIFYCRPAPRVDAAGGRTRSDSYIAFRDATDPAGNELWTTAKLNGVATDMALEDVKTAGKRGLLILTNSATGDKVRTLYFYGLD